MNADISFVQISEWKMERGVRTIQPEDSPYPSVTDRMRRTVTFCVGSGVTPRSVYAVNIGTSYGDSLGNDGLLRDRLHCPVRSRRV
jgi:hypothetical protein